MASIVDILPLEIIERIIDILASDDRFESAPYHPFQFPNVKACALTCRAFYPRSRYQRFHVVKIYDMEKLVFPNSQRVTLDEFERFVKAYPECAGGVRELHYSMRGRDIRPLIDKAVPRNLSNLQTLVLAPYHGNMDWDYVVHCPGHEADEILLQILHLPTIVSFKTMRMYNFRPSDLIPCANLQSLSLQSVTALPEDALENFSQSTPVIKNGSLLRLRHLEIGSLGIYTVAEMTKLFLPGGCQLLDLKDLKRIEIKGGLQEEYFSSTTEIFEHTRQLQYIRFEAGRQISYEDLRLIPPLITPSSHTLRALSLDITLPYATGENDDEVRDFDSILSLLHTLLALASLYCENKIKSLQIQIHIGEDSDCLERTEEWSLLKDVMVLREGWSHLTHFDLAIIVHGRGKISKERMEAFSDYRKTRFSGLFSQKYKFTYFVGKEGKYIPQMMEY